MSLVFEQVLKICKSMGVSVGEYNQEDGTYVGQTPSPDEPLMPEDLDCASTGDLGNLMNNNQEWNSYLSTRLNEFKVYLMAVEDQIKNMESIQLAQDGDETTKVTVKKAKTRVTPEYQELIFRRSVIKGVCTILEGAVQKAQNRHTTISRFIALRQQEFDDRGRTNMGAGTYRSKRPEKIAQPESTSLAPPEKKPFGSKRVEAQK